MLNTNKLVYSFLILTIFINFTSQQSLIDPQDVNNQYTHQKDIPPAQKQQIVSTTAQILIAIGGIIVIFLQSISYLRRKNLSNLINFATFTKNLLQNSQNKLNQIVTTQVPKDTQIKSQPQNQKNIQDASQRQVDLSQQKGPARRRKRKTDKLNALNNVSKEEQSQNNVQQV